MGRERLVDGGLAAAALLVVVLVAVAVEGGVRPVAIAAGVVGAIAAEFALQRRRSAVRRAWSEPPVKAATLAAFLACLSLAVAVAPAAGLSLLAGGLVGYLALLAGVAVGDAVAPP